MDTERTTASVLNCRPPEQMAQRASCEPSGRSRRGRSLWRGEGGGRSRRPTTPPAAFLGF